jgi:hypothetical protein
MDLFSNPTILGKQVSVWPAAIIVAIYYLFNLFMVYLMVYSRTALKGTIISEWIEKDVKGHGLS